MNMNVNVNVKMMMTLVVLGSALTACGSRDVSTTKVVDAQDTASFQCEDVFRDKDRKTLWKESFTVTSTTGSVEKVIGVTSGDAATAPYHAIVMHDREHVALVIQNEKTRQSAQSVIFGDQKMGVVVNQFGDGSQIVLSCIRL